MRKRTSTLLLVFILFLAFGLDAQTDSLKESNWLSKSTLEGYGNLNYYAFNWQTDTVKRNAIDNERFVLEFKYHWNDNLRLNSEIEFEHGGTGSEVEFDRFEEFGEFEFDISKGGEVWMEQMNLEYTLNDGLHIQLGRLKVPFALAFNKDEPTDYVSATLSESEAAILPTNWTENGISLFGQTKGRRFLRYYLTVVNGLDNSAFNSANWIKRGNQRRFELVNAENFAACARTDYYWNEESMAGISAYYGNTTDNRPKPDLKISAALFLVDFHTSLIYKNWFFNGTVFYGHLSNSEAVTNANRNLSNNLNVKRTPVGAAALAGFAELGNTILHRPSFIKRSETSLALVYGRVDYYDTMFGTQGQVFNNPRWERISYTGGLVYKLIDEVQLKLQYTWRKVGAPAPTSVDGGTAEKTFIAGMAFEF